MRYIAAALAAIFLTGCAGFKIIPANPESYRQAVFPSWEEYRSDTFAMREINDISQSCDAVIQSLRAEEGVAGFCGGRYFLYNNAYKPSYADGPATLRGTMGPWGYDGSTKGVTDHGDYTLVDLEDYYNAGGFVSGAAYEVNIGWGEMREPAWGQHGNIDEGKAWLKKHGLFTPLAVLREKNGQIVREKVNAFGIVVTKLQNGELRYRFARPEEILNQRANF